LSRLALVTAASPGFQLLLGSQPVEAASGLYDNALPEAKDFMPKNPGPEPKDLGLAVRKLNKFTDSEGPVLKGGGFGPNAFSTTGDREDFLATTILPYWRIPAGTEPKQAMADLQAILKAYEPGQAGVDGGGFQIMKAEPNYVYAQFASLQRGDTDDTEFVVDADGTVQVRSAGRTTMRADGGSNCKRLNYISEKLRAKGWEAPKITKDTHEWYYRQNAAKTKTQCVGLTGCPDELSLDPE